MATAATDHMIATENIGQGLFGVQLEVNIYTINLEI